jgi:uncharacterized protein
MNPRFPMLGIRIHLSGSVPDDASTEEAEAIGRFVEQLAQGILREGARLIHGSHPSFLKALESAARGFINSGGSRDALTLVRAQKYAVTETQLSEIEAQREYAAVEVIPGVYGNITESLVPMREWMAERCDVVVAVGGRWYEVNKQRAGVPAEMAEALSRGKPGFAIAGFGGAIEKYLQDDPTVYLRLRNGLSEADNRALAVSTNSGELVSKILSQVKLLPTSRETIPRGRLFRILALDGGGIRGAFTAAVLAKWDDMIKSGGGNELVKNFDLVAGTSTGAILAIGLGLGLTPIEMLEFYRTRGPSIFSGNHELRHWLKSKHESQTLRSTLQSVFGDRKLSEASCCRLVIPTVRAIHGESEAIVTAHSPDRTAFASISAVDAALASSAAPTYFDESIFDDSVAAETFLDGGIWANNPVLPAIAEALRHLRVPLDRIDVLSVGTLGSEADFTKSLGKGMAGWALSSTDLFFAAQEHAAASLASNLLGFARYLRVNQHTPTAIKLDDASAIEDMASRGVDVAKDSFITVRSRFLDGFQVPDWRQAMKRQV